MTADFEKELTWFTKRLLQIRLTEIRGIGIPIPFELSDIKERTIAGFFDAKLSPKEHLEELIEEVRQFYIKNNGNTANGDRIKLVYHENDLSVKIFGLDSDLLRSFLTVRLKSHTSLFETGSGNALFYVGSPTDVTLSATEQTILAHFKDADDWFLSYDDIFEICALHKGIKEASFRSRNDSEEKQGVSARGTISGLLKKMKQSEILASISSAGIIKNIPGEGYRLMM